MPPENNFTFLMQELLREWRRKVQFLLPDPDLNLGAEHSQYQVKLFSTIWLCTGKLSSLYSAESIYRRRVVEN